MNLYFEDFEQVVAVFSNARHRIRNQAGPSGEKFGVVRNALMKLSGKQIVHNYGRIDRDPKTRVKRSVELALVRSDRDHNYWFALGLRKQEYFEWPAEVLITAIETIADEMAGMVGKF